MTTSKAFWVALFLLAANLTGAIVTGSTLYYQISYLLIFLIAGGWIYTLISLTGIGVIRDARTKRQQVGQNFEEYFTIGNNSRLLHLWIEVRDLSDLPGSAASRVFTWLKGKRERNYISFTWLTKRGLYQLGPTEIRSGDLFGFFSIKKQFPSKEILLVIPFFTKLDYFPSPPGLLPGGRALRIKTLEATPYAAGVREFYPGDALNRIHWPSTARKDRLMVKEFEHDPLADIWIFLDANKNAQFEIEKPANDIFKDKLSIWMRRPEIKLPDATFEYAVSIVASIADYYIRQKQAVGLVSSGQMFVELPPEKGERQFGKILETLAFLQPEGEISMHGLVSMQISHLPRGSTVVLVSPSIEQETILIVDELQSRRINPIVVLIDASTFGGNQIGIEDVIDELIARSVPVKRVANHDNIKYALEKSYELIDTISGDDKESAPA